MSDCAHDCSTCGQSCRDRGNPDRHEFRVDLNPGSTVKKVIAVVSGKGGVGKSFVTSLLASEMQRRGHNAAVLDADITGPSIPKSFGITGHAMGTDSYLYPAYTKSGIQVMSMNMILEDNSQPAVWRGPVIAGAVKQFWSDVLWTDVDYMFVDMPPGTGDVPLTVFQSLPVDGVVIVTSPQDLVSMIVAKAVNMAKMMDVPIIGVAENMSYLKCPDCGKEIPVFGTSHIEEIAAGLRLPVLGRMPVDPDFAVKADTGAFHEIQNGYLEAAAAVLPRNE